MERDLILTPAMEAILGRRDQSQQGFIAKFLDTEIRCRQALDELTVFVKVFKNSNFMDPGPTNDYAAALDNLDEAEKMRDSLTDWCPVINQEQSDTLSAIHALDTDRELNDILELMIELYWIPFKSLLMDLQDAIETLEQACLTCQTKLEGVAAFEWEFTERSTARRADYFRKRPSRYSERANDPNRE